MSKSPLSPADRKVLAGVLHENVIPLEWEGVTPGGMYGFIPNSVPLVVVRMTPAAYNQHDEIIAWNITILNLPET